jgi:hypothetical protein
MQVRVDAIDPHPTEFGILADPRHGDCRLRLRFEDDVRVRIGGSARRAVAERHAVKGLRPVVVNGVALLELTDPSASLTLPLAAGRHTLRLLGVVRGAHPRDAIYHVTERIGDRVLGGVALQIAGRAGEEP